MSVFSIPLHEVAGHYVYTALCQDEGGPGYVKFGRSGLIGPRLSQLRAACPVPVHYFGVLDCGDRQRSIEVERALHAHFESRRIKGEWYRFDFSSKEDKRAFNDGCRLVFALELGPTNVNWWTKVSVKALDEYNRERQVAFLRSKHRKRLEFGARSREQQKKAWKELDEYGRIG